MSEPQELQLAGRVRMAAVAAGPEDAPPVLALHGWLDNAGTFATLLPRLPGYHIVAVDLPGHGMSDALPPAMAYHFMDHLQDLGDAARDLGWSRYHLLGHSMGGALALAYAAAFPEQVASVVTIDALGPVTDDPARLPQRLRQALEPRSREAARGRQFATFDEAVAARRADGHLGAAGARALAERGVIREGGVWRWAADRRHRWPSIHRLSEPQVLALLGAVRAPVLVLRATESQFALPPGVGAARLDALADVTVREIPGRHHFHLDSPESCADEILAFWSAVPSASV